MDANVDARCRPSSPSGAGCSRSASGPASSPLPLRAAGHRRSSGLDLSPAMLGKLVEKAGGGSPFPLVLGDATRMPFADGAFGAAYCRWVLHLIPDWRAGVAELVRVVRPGAVLLVNPGRTAGTGGICGAVRRAAGDRRTDPVGLAWATTARRARRSRWPALDTVGARRRRRGRRRRAARGLPRRRRGKLLLLDVERLGRRPRLARSTSSRAWPKERYGPLDESRARRVATRLARLRPALTPAERARPAGILRTNRPGDRRGAASGRGGPCRSRRSTRSGWTASWWTGHDAQIHVLSHALHYGSGVFEGIRAYETARGPAVWHLDEHLKRLFRSAKLYHMDIPYSTRGDHRGDEGHDPRERAERLLHPAARVPRLRRDGREPADRAGQRGRSRSGRGAPTWARTRWSRASGSRSRRGSGTPRTRCRPPRRRPASTSTACSRRSRA